MHHSSARDNQLFIQQHFRKGVLFVFYLAYSLASCGSSQHSCSGGTKNSPPDCFLNAPTILKEIITLFHSTTLSLRKRCFSLYTVFTLCSCGSSQHSCSGGTKNSPPDCFLNAPTVQQEIISIIYTRHSFGAHCIRK